MSATRAKRASTTVTLTRAQFEEVQRALKSARQALQSHYDYEGTKVTNRDSRMGWAEVEVRGALAVLEA